MLGLRRVQSTQHAVLLVDRFHPSSNMMSPTSLIIQFSTGLVEIMKWTRKLHRMRQAVKVSAVKAVALCVRGHWVLQGRGAAHDTRLRMAVHI